jgi:hypothetical protein
VGHRTGRSPQATAALRLPQRANTPLPLAPGLAWGLWALGIAINVVGLALFALGNDALSAAARAGLVASMVPALASATVGAVIVSRRPGNAVGWLCCAIGLGLSLSAFGSPNAYAALAADPSRIPGGLVLYGFGGLAYELSWDLMALLLLVFPTGRLPSPRWRPFVWAAGALLAVCALWGPFTPGPVAPGLPANPFGIEALGDARQLVYGVATAVLAAVALAAAVSLVARFRRAAGAERQQLKWFAYGTALLALVGVAYNLAGEQGLVGPITEVLLFPILTPVVPVTIGVAVLRYRLYDIDRIINRTLVYGLLTALLAAVYAGIVLILGQVFGGIGAEPPTWAVAGATLAVAALFQPARRRIQGVVDRRFNRRKYNAARTIDAFSARLRDEVDLDTLSAELLGVVDQTMQPTSASLWLQPSVGGRRTGT